MQEDRHVIVVTFEDYLSKEYMERIDNRVEGLKFQTLKQNSGSFMRLATKMPANHEQRDLPIPLLLHGNTKEQRKLCQATADVCGVEEDVLKMTETFYQIADGVAREAMEMIRYKTKG